MLNLLLEDTAQVIQFNAAVYGLKAIRKAATAFGTSLNVFVEPHGHITEVRLIPKECSSSARRFVCEFCSEVLDQELRERVSVELAGVCSLLCSRAFPSLSCAEPASAMRSVVN